jgi:uncharacterized protein (TIRG00374 family)
VGSALGSARALPLALGVVLILASYPLLAARWRTIVRQTAPAPSEGRMLELVLVGAAVNNVLPGRLGEIARSYGLSRSNRRPLLECLGTVVVDRIADLVLFVALLGATAATAPSRDWVRWIVWGGVAMTVVGIAALVVVAAVRRRRGARSDSGLLRQVDALLDGLDSIRSWRCLGTVALFTVAAWGVWMVGAWLVARSLGIGLSASQIAFTTGVLGLGSTIPAAPGFIGTYHWLAASALGLFGVAQPDAVAFAVILHAAWFVPTTVIGVALLVRRGTSLPALRRVSLHDPSPP